jgi:hypothetical protein
MVPDRRQLLRAYLLSATVVLVAAGGSLLFMETASVKLSVPRHSIEAYVPLAGGPTGGPLQTQRIAASITESQQGTASTVEIGATYAAGQVVFRCSPSCSKAPVIIAPGTLITNGQSLGYATQALATIATTTGSATADVRATSPGAAWNSDINTLTIIADNSDTSLKVTNPAAIAGGVNAHSAQVIQQSDYDGVLNALNLKVNKELGAALYANAHQADYVGDPQPVIVVTSDHSVGEAVPSFTITISGKVGATTFSESQANTIMLAALKAKAGPGQDLTNDPIQYIYQSNQVAPNVDLLVTGKADGFVIPKLSAQTLSAQIRGLSPAEAARSLQRAAPGSLIEIRISPSAAPFLPLIAEHISINVVVDTSARAGAKGL